MIDSLGNSDERKVLMEYYLSPDLPTWDDVADRPSFSRQRVLQIHGNAIRKLNIMPYQWKRYIADEY